MTRTRLKDRLLPSYTKGEEIFNMVTHIVGGAMGIAALVLCVLVSAHKGSLCGVLCSIVFGASMTLLYTTSSVYHGLRPNMAKKVFQVLDHCTIYLLIAGTYTPMMLCGLVRIAPVAAWVTFGAVWGMAALATVFTAIDLHKYKHFSMICYVGMGWAVLFSIRATYAFLGDGFWLLLGGGFAYTGGILFYKLGDRIPYTHAIFHLFTLVGSLTHALCVLLYVL